MAKKLSNELEQITVDVAIAEIKNYLRDLQNRICHFLEDEDTQAKFLEDEWQYRDGGGGITRVLNNGKNIEKAGVNFSHVRGQQLPQAATVKRPELANTSFQALGVSVVVHPNNPYVPTSHFNIRFIVVEKSGAPFWWFGGGFDLTPYYGFDEDCVHWHKTAKEACDPFGADLYQQYKNWADDYFYLTHRQEPRGIGGIFFDDLNQFSFQQSFNFMRSVGDHFIKAYQPIMQKRKNHPYTTREREFQIYRRGRYVEFNLLYDRGTLFGLQSGGRTESILMSLPPMVSWVYNWRPEPGSKEETLYTKYLIRKNWI